MTNKRTILIVDDQEINRKILTKILENNYKVLCAKNGAEALEILNEKGSTISAVLLDLIMPVMDGFEVLKKMKKDIKLKDMPVIVATQKEDDDSEVEVLAMGANDFVSKPYKAQVILQRLSNIIKMREYMEKLADAETDYLTGLYNKKVFYIKVGEENKSLNEKYEIIVADIENFKIFNDAFGWNEGDELLQFIAEKLKEILDKDAIISHSEADKFYIFTKRQDDTEDKLYLLEKKIREFKPAYKINMKFGVYLIDDDEMRVNLMCDNANLAVNKIKGIYNKKICYYESSFRDGLIVEQKITNIMQEALAENQFKVYLQPKYNINTNSIVGAEALIRWIHPEFGFMSPGEFIPIFEKNGFITKVDMFVWERVCYLQQEWKKKIGHFLPVSVNVSRKDIYFEDLPQFFENLIEKYDLDPRCLHLEITETAYIENTQQLIDTVSRLKDLGFIIEMDDFGSGYSSLNILSELPIDVLKMDMKLIQSEPSNRNFRNIMDSIVRLAKWMNLLVIAEGVETEEQLNYLKEIRCDFAQGYFYAKPMPEEVFSNELEIRNIEPIFDMGSYVDYITVENESQNPDSDTILIVDDLKMNRAIIAEALKEKYNVVEVENGKTALKYIERNYDSIKAIITDLYMPAMDGFELLDEVKNNSKFSDIPVIITSSSPKDCNKDNDRLKNADGFILKPFETEEILQVVGNISKKIKK